MALAQRLSFTPPTHPMHHNLAWARTETGCLFRLAGIDTTSPAVSGQGGIYLIGVGTFLARCLEAGHADDIGSALARARHDLAQHAPEGGRNLSLTWAFVPMEARDPVLRYLVNRLRPIRISRHGANFRATDPRPVNVPPEFHASADIPPAA